MTARPGRGTGRPPALELPLGTSLSVKLDAGLVNELRAASRTIPRRKGGRQGLIGIIEFALEEWVEALREEHNDGQPFKLDREARRRTVYFAHDAHRGNVKIGVTSGDPAVRITNMRTAAPDIRLLAWISNAPRGLEKELHTRWAEYRVGGEWFDLWHVLDFQNYLEEHATFPE